MKCPECDDATVRSSPAGDYLFCHVCGWQGNTADEPAPSWTEEEIREAVIAQLRDWIAIPDESSRGIFADHVLSRLATLKEKNQ